MKEHTHIGVYGFAIYDGKTLLIKKGRGPFIGKYDLPGGEIVFGESPEEALVREIMEETGLVVENRKLINVLSNVIEWTTPCGDTEKLHHIGLIFSVTLNNYDYSKSGPDGEDSLESMWLSLNKLDSKELTPFAKECMNNSYKKLTLIYSVQLQRMYYNFFTNKFKEILEAKI